MRLVKPTPDFAPFDDSGGLLPQRIGMKAVVLSIFVIVHANTLWLNAANAGLACAWLCARTGRLWVTVIAHAVTNGALGVRVGVLDETWPNDLCGGMSASQ